MNTVAINAEHSCYKLLDKLNVSTKSFYKSFDNLPEDQYCPGGFRFRSFSRYRIENGEIVKLNHRYFRQSKKINKLWGDDDRMFGVANDDIEAEDDFKTLVWSFIESCQYDPSEIEIGYHPIRTTCQFNMRSAPAPEGIHRDGFRYIGLFCVRRQDVVGAETMLYESLKGGKPIFRGTLSESEMLLVKDDEIFHYTSPITTDNEEGGLRDIIVLTLVLRSEADDVNALAY